MNQTTSHLTTVLLAILAGGAICACVQLQRTNDSLTAIRQQIEMRIDRKRGAIPNVAEMIYDIRFDVKECDGKLATIEGDAEHIKIMGVQIAR